LTEEWNSKALDIAYVRKRFLRDALRDRLVGADTTALQGQPKGLESLKQVSAMQVKGLSDVPAAQRDVWKLRSVKELLNGEQDLLQDIAENPAIEAFWRKVHELRFLTENWPDNVLATADFLTH
jgi:hypothetical protein